MDVTKCLIDGCERQAHSRGLCQKCHPEMLRRIASGELSESTAIRRGWILPAKKRGPKAKSPVSVLLEKTKSRK